MNIVGNPTSKNRGAILFWNNFIIIQYFVIFAEYSLTQTMRLILMPDILVKASSIWISFFLRTWLMASKISCQTWKSVMFDWTTIAVGQWLQQILTVRLLQNPYTQPKLTHSFKSYGFKGSSIVKWKAISYQKEIVAKYFKYVKVQCNQKMTYRMGQNFAHFEKSKIRYDLGVSHLKWTIWGKKLVWWFCKKQNLICDPCPEIIVEQLFKQK